MFSTYKFIESDFDELVKEIFGEAKNVKSDVDYYTTNTDNKLVFEFILPGADKDKLKLSLDGDELILKYGGDKRIKSFEKTFKLKSFNPETIEAKYIDGVLNVYVYKQTKPKSSKVIDII